MTVDCPKHLETNIIQNHAGDRVSKIANNASIYKSKYYKKD